jgi:hypothetical protein
VGMFGVALAWVDELELEFETLLNA